MKNELFYRCTVNNEYYSSHGVIYRHQITCESTNYNYSFYHHFWFMWSNSLGKEISVPTYDRDTADMISDLRLRPVSQEFAKMTAYSRIGWKRTKIGKGVLETYED